MANIHSSHQLGSASEITNSYTCVHHPIKHLIGKEESHSWNPPPPF
jgi:hypothetical protein